MVIDRFRATIRWFVLGVGLVLVDAACRARPAEQPGARILGSLLLIMAG